MHLGTVKASTYIYITPVVTLITSVFILREPVTWLAGSGIALTSVGLLFSGWKGNNI